MPVGFFHSSTLIEKSPISRIAACGACKLYKNCKSPKMPFSGKGKKRILIVGEAPGKEDDERGTHFHNKAGIYLEKQLRKLGIDMRRDCWLHNAVICRPPGHGIPTDAQVDHCRANLINTVEQLNPTSIILLGKIPVQSTMSWLWKDEVDELSRWLGWPIPSQELNAWIVPNWHPSYIVRTLEEDGKKQSRRNANRFLIERVFIENLEKAIDRTERPWKSVPNYEKEIQLITNPREAKKAILKGMAMGKPAAFDYETNTLKPDDSYAAIASCSISFGGSYTIAYPWQGEAIEQTKLFLESDIPKVGANIKFEDRWTRAKLGIPVKNFIWDTMINAHIMDSRDGITSVKFQSFILLGYGAYEEKVHEFLKARKGMKTNNIFREVDLEDLLRYNALDSLLEYKIAKIQQRKMLGATTL